MRRYVLALSICSFISLPALADASNDAAWNDAYARVLANPRDSALNRDYLELTLMRGDYEAAIPPIERLLMKTPNDPALTLQLGQMYQKLGSYKVAKGYFKKVSNDPAASDELRAQAASAFDGKDQ